MNKCLKLIPHPSSLCNSSAIASRVFLRISVKSSAFAVFVSIGGSKTISIVPPEANLEEKAFSLNKGCYPGQEVVARMDTYGSVRRRMVTLLLDPEVAVQELKTA